MRREKRTKKTQGSRNPRKVPRVLEKEGLTSQAAIFIVSDKERIPEGGLGLQRR